LVDKKTIIRKYIKKAEFKKVKEYNNGFLIPIPGERIVVKLHVLLTDTTIKFRSKGLIFQRGNKADLFEHLLKLNFRAFMAYWGINKSGAIFVGYERLIKDLDFTEFYAATDCVISEFEDHIDELKKFIK